MKKQDPVNDPPNSLWAYFKDGFRRQNARRPISFYLMLAIIVVLLLGLQIANYRDPDNAAKFALVLSAMFVFFFVVLWRASVEMMEIIRRSYREERELFQSTLGNREFAEELGKRVAESAPPERDDEELPLPPDD